MIVMKFGGTSVEGPSRMRDAAELVAARRDRCAMVVVSAMGGVTNLLLAAAKAAARGDEAELRQSLASVRCRHESALAELLPESSSEEDHRLEDVLSALEDLVQGIFLVRECSARSLDAVVSVGEVLSHRLFALALRARGVEAVAVDPRDLMPTDDTFGEASVDSEELARRCTRLVRPHVEAGRVPVTGGFVGATGDGAPTTLGRGGSDHSATLLGVALDVDEVEVWTDVDGLMTADPRVVKEARPLREVSFQAAAELAYFGARVLHPATIRPAVKKGLTVRVLNSLRPEEPGTAVRDLPDEDLPPGGVVRAVAWKRDIATVAISSSRMLGAHGFLAEIFSVFDKYRTPVDVVTTSEVSVSMTVERTDRLEQVARDLERLGRVKVERDMALVCLVGRQLLEFPALVGAILSELDGIPLRMFCLGSSDINLTLVVENRLAEEVVQRLHARFLVESPCPT